MNSIKNCCQTVLGDKVFETHSPWMYGPAFFSLWPPLLLTLSIVKLYKQPPQPFYGVGHPDLPERVCYDGTPVPLPDQVPVPMEGHDILGI